MFDFINPTIEIGSFGIAWYAICILIGVLFAVIMGVKEGKRLGISSDDIYWGVIIILPIAIVGARLWYILFNLDQHWSFRKIIGLEGGLAGLAIQGGVIFALIAVFVYCKVKHLSLYRIIDLVAPGFLIGQICGRWGNFCNHELFGPVVSNQGFANFLYNIPLIGENMCFTGSGPGAIASTNLANLHHPTFLYESLLNLVGLIIILVARRKFNKLKSGDTIGFYLCWYGTVRIFTETLRMMGDPNDPLMLGPVPVSIAVSVIFIICGILYLVLKRVLANQKWLINSFGKSEYYQDVLTFIKDNKMDTVIFDLDGTLLDTKPLIDRSFIYTFEHFRPGYVLSEDELDSFFGPTLKQTFSRYSDDPKEIDEMIKYYRSYNVSNHDALVKPFSGAKEMLQTLHKNGYKLGIVSSKKTDLVKHGLELFGLLKYISMVVGEDDGIAPKPAPDGILYVKKHLGGKNVAYVGDTLNDIKAAKAAHVKAIGVIYGKHPEIMLEAKPDDVISKLSDVVRICGE